jgi:hypothetical protein
MSYRKDVRLLNVYRSCHCSYKIYWQCDSLQISYRRKKHIAVSKENNVDSPANFVQFTVNFTAIALLSTYSAPYLWHVSYRDMQFDIPCWQNIMTCFINHDACFHLAIIFKLKAAEVCFKPENVEIFRLQIRTLSDEFQEFLQEERQVL